MVSLAEPIPEIEEFSWCLRSIGNTRRRTMAQFAVQEITLPSGPYEGQKFNLDRQPYVRHLYYEIDSGRWVEMVTLGPSQTGKSLTCFVIPTLYHLFECAETVVCGVPSLDMSGDKWREDLLPVIQRTRYRELLPEVGGGSRGGNPTAIKFKNGATLRFMTGGGDDKSRAGFTARVLVVTETDGFDEQGETSRESTKIKQLEARTRAFGRRRRIYKECTVSTETGHIWTKYKSGTESRLALPCPHCREFVTPEREHFTGWETAESVQEAAEKGRIFCPSCGEGWSDDQRLVANRNAILLHKGQKATKDGEILGEPPNTETFGFRWTATNNMLWSQEEIAKEEWEKSREVDSDAAELEMRQFVWTLPAQPSAKELAEITVNQLMARALKGANRGVVPAHSMALTVGVDLGLRTAHWVAIAWNREGGGVVIDYSEHPIPSQSMGVEVAIVHALRELRDTFEAGWAHEQGGALWKPDQVWVDLGYYDSSVFQFVRESGSLKDNRYRGAKGFGMKDGRVTHYLRPAAKTAKIHHIGEEYHFAMEEEAGEYRIDVNADHWKSFLHGRLSVPVRSPDALQFYEAAAPKEHFEIAKQFTVEAQIEEYLPGKGFVKKWTNKHKRANHYFDAAYNACAAGHFCGVRLIEVEKPAAPVVATETKESRARLTTPDGRPFFVLERE